MTTTVFFPKTFSFTVSKASGRDAKTAQVVKLTSTKVGEGKKTLLKAAGLPTDLPSSTPAEARWGKEVTIEHAKTILGI